MGAVNLFCIDSKWRVIFHVVAMLPEFRIVIFNKSHTLMFTGHDYDIIMMF